MESMFGHSRRHEEHSAWQEVSVIMPNHMASLTAENKNLLPEESNQTSRSSALRSYHNEVATKLSAALAVFLIPLMIRPIIRRTHPQRIHQISFTASLRPKQ